MTSSGNCPGRVRSPQPIEKTIFAVRVRSGFVAENAEKRAVWNDTAMVRAPRVESFESVSVLAPTWAVTSSVRNRPEGVAPDATKPHGPNMESRIAVLEEIASSTRATLKEMREDLRFVRDKQEADFRILVGLQATSILALAGMMAHGFHWF